MGGCLGLRLEVMDSSALCTIEQHCEEEFVLEVLKNDVPRVRFGRGPSLCHGPFLPR